MTATVRLLQAEAAALIGGSAAQREAEMLLQHALGRSRAWLYAHGDAAPDASSAAAFRALVARRAAGEPVAYIVGHREFWSLDLEVGPNVLIPRPETELLVELALQRIPQATAAQVADLGTGSGAIALAIACERPHASVVATDASAPALALAQRNARRSSIPNVTFASGDWCGALGDRRFDVIVTNPPYIAANDPHLGQGDLRHEPRAALASGADGLDAIRTITARTPAHLSPGAWLLLEHGFDQGGVVRELLAQSGFVEVFTALDLERRERVSGGRTPG
jgi:release factor glutamine methyltransferase